jgi:hypothetical protein
VARRAAHQEALALAEHDLDIRRESLLVRSGKGRRRRELGMDEWGEEQLRPSLRARGELPVGPLCCIIDGPTRGRPWARLWLGDVQPLSRASVVWPRPRVAVLDLRRDRRRRDRQRDAVGLGPDATGVATAPRGLRLRVARAWFDQLDLNPYLGVLV